MIEYNNIEDAVKVINITKKFGELVAVNNVTINIKKKEIFGLLGPNGAGKTTLIRMLTTLLKPTSGYAEVWGYNILRDRDNVRASIGVVFQDTSIDGKLTGKENLDFHARMYGIDKKVRENRIKEVLRLVELEDKANILVENYSGGMQRRLEIARGLMHHPKVLFLDEPTLGLDAQTRRHIWDYILKMNKEEDVTIILTTHYMDEADYLCGRIAIIDNGKIVTLDTSSNLKSIIGGDVISLEITTDLEAFAKNTLSKLDWIKKLSVHDVFLNLTVVNGESKIPELINLAQRNEIEIRSVALHKPTLEDVFIHFTGKTIRESEATAKEKLKQMSKGWGKPRR